jgi:hypothetical protein
MHQRASVEKSDSKSAEGNLMGVRFPLPAPKESMSYRDKRIFGCVFLCPNYGQAGIRFVPEHRGEIDVLVEPHMRLKRIIMD